MCGDENTILFSTETVSRNYARKSCAVSTIAWLLYDMHNKNAPAFVMEV